MKKKHILLIDDNDIDTYITKHIIKKSQLTEKITTKNSGIAAIEYLTDIKDNADEFPDLIFLDIGMPIMNGFGFLDELVKLLFVIEGKCEVVMLTSSNDDNDIERAKQYPVVKEYLVKPMKLEKLEALL